MWCPLKGFRYLLTFVLIRSLGPLYFLEAGRPGLSKKRRVVSVDSAEPLLETVDHPINFSLLFAITRFVCHESVFRGKFDCFEYRLRNSPLSRKRSRCNSEVSAFGGTKSFRADLCASRFDTKTESGAWDED